jgi:hypothetical protein
MTAFECWEKCNAHFKIDFDAIRQLMSQPESQQREARLQCEI